MPQAKDCFAQRYAHLAEIRRENCELPMFSGQFDRFLVVLVNARHLDYSSFENFIQTLRWGPVFPREPIIGHAWVILGEKKEGKTLYFEAGHTGELGGHVPRYLDEVMRRACMTNDPNPAKYFFTVLPDGQLEVGSGGHVPTFAIALPLTKEQVARIHRLFEPDGYDFSQWGLQGPQCVRFVRSCLAAVGVNIVCSETLHLPQKVVFQGTQRVLWTDPVYSTLVVETPDLLEKRMWELVCRGEALTATQWYQKHWKKEYACMECK
jgi:hypothetical protein